MVYRKIFQLIVCILLLIPVVYADMEYIDALAKFWSIMFILILLWIVGLVVFISRFRNRGDVSKKKSLKKDVIITVIISLLILLAFIIRETPKNITTGFFKIAFIIYIFFFFVVFSIISVVLSHAF